MSLESSASLWDGISFWLIGIGAVLAGVGTIAAVHARKLGRELTTEKTAIAAREKVASDRAIAEANARAKEADAHAAEANLELAKFKAPRQLTPEQSKNITDAAKPFTGTRFTVAVFNDQESMDLLSQIESALISAGWIETAWKGGGDVVLTRPEHPIVGLTPMQGVFVQADNSYMTEFGLAVTTLASALTAKGIPAKAEIGRMPPNTDNDVVQILVGKK